IGVGRRAQQLMGLPKGMQIVAISDVNAVRLKELTEQRDWKTYTDYREMLESKDIDAVVIATPDHWHALNSIHACQAGKDVYVEKPMTLTVAEGRAMVDAARKHGRIVQVGSQQRSMPECRLGCELVRNGRIGAIKLVHGANFPSPWDCDLPEQPVPEGLNWDVWCGQTEPRPYHIDLYLPRADGRMDAQGRPLGWISFRPYSGGEMTGWGAHGLDIIQWALGYDESGPVEVWPEGEGLTCPVSFRYDNGVVVTLDGKGSGGGGLFEGEKGEIWIARAECKTTPKEIADVPLTDADVRLYKSDNHLQNWLDCIRSREKSSADVEIGHRTTTMCHLGNIARWTGRKLQWDPKTERFVNDADADTYLSRPMRAPYRIESPA
ncbi:MAG: hypothetical protein QG656_2150, partial [Candidatus Hydrogenedentes bacterium]|nr:hypothetical protein [Candidatus Hydrogenedentota bacterium]